MCFKKCTSVILILAALAILGGCGALDDIIPSTGTYKINAKINNTSLDDFSIVSSKDKIQPFFEAPVSEDMDITELVVFLKDLRGLTTGYKVTYSLTYYDKDNNNEDAAELQIGQSENKKDKDDIVLAGTDESKEKSNEEKESENTDLFGNIKYVKKGNEIIFPVISLDGTLPFFPLPPDLPIGKYTLVFQVMGKNTILSKYEKPLFYLADAEFSFKGIQVNLPGIAESSQFIQNGNVILLEVNLTFDSRLEPYVIWYNGKKIIDEGLYSDGMKNLLWKAPEQNGFVSLRAEVFPSRERTGLAGHQKGISLLVSSKEIDMHLLSEDTPNLVQWYTFEGDLNDSLTKNSEKRGIAPVERNKPDWLPSNGTYGLASGDNITYKLPDIPFTNNEKGSWQIISRFKPLSEGDIFSVHFGPVFDVTMTLSNKKSNLVLTLTSAVKTYSETLNLSDEEDSFVTVSVKFIIQSGRLSAKMALVKPALTKNFINQNEPVVNPIIIDVDLDKEFNIALGQQKKTPPEDNTQTVTVQKPVFTTLWDELAILHTPDVEIKLVKTNAETITPPPPPPPFFFFFI